jgi:hypothetical protein
MNYTEFRIAWRIKFLGIYGGGSWQNVSNVSVQELNCDVELMNDHSKLFEYWVEYR